MKHGSIADLNDLWYVGCNSFSISCMYTQRRAQAHTRSWHLRGLWFWSAELLQGVEWSREREREAEGWKGVTQSEGH